LCIALCLSKAVGSRAKKEHSVAEALTNNRWTMDISGALTMQVILEYLLIWDSLRDEHLNDSLEDRVCWVWTPDKTFSTSSAYRAFYVGQYQVNGAKVLHKTRAPGKCKFLVWLALHDRCWTAERRKCHGLQDDDACILCNQEPESIDHLLLLCPFSREIWFRVLSWFSWGEVAPDSQAFNLAVWWAAARKRIPRDTRKGFDSIVVLVSWLLWKERNNRTFDRRARTTQEMQVAVIDEAVMWIQAGFKGLEVAVAATIGFPGRFVGSF